MNENIKIVEQFVEMTDEELKEINGGQHMQLGEGHGFGWLDYYERSGFFFH